MSTLVGRGDTSDPQVKTFEQVCSIGHKIILGWDLVQSGGPVRGIPVS